MDDSSPNTLANVTVLLTLEDGSTSIRNTFFVYEDGSWMHRFSAQEYEVLANAGSATASASSSASQSASASGSPNPSPNPSPDRNNNAPKPKMPGSGAAAPRGGSDINCDQVEGPIRTPPGDPNNLDGDGDGWACE
jgi:hypothetical protein